ncbi:hypothetical protein LALCM10_160183 [Dellaglioa algida]|nr:hypothetical protein LALCM10_160183 [Dellaglioa algida]
MQQTILVHQLRNVKTHIKWLTLTKHSHITAGNFIKGWLLYDFDNRYSSHFFGYILELEGDHTKWQINANFH